LRAGDGGEAVELFKSHRRDYADGDQSRDFIFVDDAVATTLWFLDHGPSHGLFNVGTGVPLRSSELAKALFHAVGRKPTSVSFLCRKRRAIAIISILLAGLIG
jgi:ADP-L-glycero-D-manno-heptose 6-epimerase